VIERKHTTIDLLPCPFCGGEARESYNGGDRYIVCGICWARGETINVRKLPGPNQNNVDAYRIVSEKWNTRIISEEAENASYEATAKLGW